MRTSAQDTESEGDRRPPALRTPRDAVDPGAAPGTARDGGDPVAARSPGPGRPVSPAVARRLQGAIGNRATGKVLAQRRPASRPAVQRLVAGRSGPDTDPKFAALKADVRGKEQALTAHPPAAAEATAAQSAARPPQDDKEAQGKAANAERMNAARPGEFDKAAFVRSVNEAIAAQAPKNLDEADSFATSGRADAVRGQVAGQVGAGRQRSAAQIESATAAPPDTSAARDKPVTPLAPDRPPPAPGAPDPARAVPDPAPPAATDLSAGPRQVEDQMAAADVTEEQLARANEPEFGEALAAKKEGEAHAATAPGAVRAAEAQTLAGVRAEAAQTGAAAMTAMAADRRQAGVAVSGGKTETRSADEARRAQVTATLQKVFDATRKDVEDILSGLDRKVDEKFAAGEKAARDVFTADHKRRMDEYKDKRYSGVAGAARWVSDKLTRLPAEADQIFVQARAGYVARMQQVISTVADLIGAELGRAKNRIAEGRSVLQAEVARLPKDLQGLGRQAAAEFAGRFDELGEAVRGKGQELVQSLAAKYKEALGKVDEEIAAEKEKNKGLTAKAMDAVGGVVKTILELKSTLLGILAKASAAVTAIIKDPIDFLGKLVSAVGAGLRGFLANIGTHLKKGLLGWLTGAMAGAGLQLPAKFDLRGILGMVASLLGLTWAAIRGRIVKRGVPDRAVSAVEAGVPIAQKLQSEGVAGIWQEIAAKVGDLKANLFGKITQFLIPTVLIAGITWVISLLNPASAFVKAVKAIVDFVTFIVERGAQIAAFVNGVLDAVLAIAAGGTGGVPALIENALALSVPVLIGALAALLGIGGVADRVKKFFQSLAKPVLSAVEWVTDRLVRAAKKLWAKLKSAAKRAKDKLTGKKDKPLSRSDMETRVRLAVTAASEKLAAVKLMTRQSLDAILGPVRRGYNLKSLTASQKGRKFEVTGTINPKHTVDVSPIALPVRPSLATIRLILLNADKHEYVRTLDDAVRQQHAFDGFPGWCREAIRHISTKPVSTPAAAISQANENTRQVLNAVAELADVLRLVRTYRKKKGVRVAFNPGGKGAKVLTAAGTMGTRTSFDIHVRDKSSGQSQIVTRTDVFHFHGMPHQGGELRDGIAHAATKLAPRLRGGATIKAESTVVINWISGRYEKPLTPIVKWVFMPNGDKWLEKTGSDGKSAKERSGNLKAEIKSILRSGGYGPVDILYRVNIVDQNGKLLWYFINPGWQRGSRQWR